MLQAMETQPQRAQQSCRCVRRTQIVLLPTGVFICTGDVVALLKTRLNSITAEAAWVECQIEVPIERWMKRGEPKYPRGGEPESYFQQYDMDRDFEAGFGNDMFRVHHDSTVPIFVAQWSREEPNPTPKLEGLWPLKSHLVLGKVKPHSIYGPLFCSEPFAEVLLSIQCDNFELIPLN